MMAGTTVRCGVGQSDIYGTICVCGGSSYLIVSGEYDPKQATCPPEDAEDATRIFSDAKGAR